MATFEIDLSKIIKDHVKNDATTQDKYIEHLCVPFANNDEKFQKQRGLHAVLLTSFLLIENIDTDSVSRHVANSINTDISIIECMGVLLDMVESVSETINDLITNATINDNVILEFEC